MKNKIAVFIFSLIGASQALATELFVRPDGGTWAQCNGQTNAPYSESVTGMQCAVNHIFELLAPESRAVRISGGDIITIMNNSDGSAAEYAMGSHGIYDGGNCHSSWAYDCYMPSLPSGTPENPTILRGELNNGQCETKPILWGTARAKRLISIDGASNVELQCLTITDKSSCIGASGYPDNSLVCDRGTPYNKPFADTGIQIIDSSEIKLTDVDVQGLAKGIYAGRINNVYLTRVNLFANHSVGWDGDIGDGGSSNTGTISFVDSSINFNGCGLVYNPGEADHNQPHACARQNIGGYGDGMGTASTGGDWYFDNTQVMHNASDGIDLLYHNLEGSIIVKNSRLEGNAGNQVKVSGNSVLSNNIIIGNCAWNSRQVDSLGGEGEICRAGGTPISISYTHTDTKIKLINNTVYSEGDIIVSSGNRTGVAVDSQTLYVVNNVFYARIDYRQNFENSALYYTDSPFPITQVHNNIIHKPKNWATPCESFNNNIPAGDNANEGFCTNAGSTTYYDNADQTVISNPHFPDLDFGVRYTAYDVNTLNREGSQPYPMDINSPVVNNGYSASIDGTDIPTTDFYGNPRVGLPDIGAVEYAPKPNPPVILQIQEQ